MIQELKFCSDDSKSASLQLYNCAQQGKRVPSLLSFITAAINKFQDRKNRKEPSQKTNYGGSLGVNQKATVSKYERLLNLLQIILQKFSLKMSAIPQNIAAVLYQIIIQSGDCGGAFYSLAYASAGT